MVTIASLWLPILVSGVFVFIISSIMHMVFSYHKTDFRKIPNEDEVMDALKSFNIPPGDYVIPHADSMKERQSEEFKEKVKKGPVAFFTSLPNEEPSMTGSLIQWFLYSVLVSIFAAYIAGRALGPDAYYLEIFRFVGATAFIGYSMALIQNSIWYNKSWAATLKSVFDGFIFALVTAGTFGWLWPN